MLLVTGIAQATKMMIAGDFVLGKLAVLMLLMLVVSMLAVVGVGACALSWRMAITFYKKREIQ